MSMPLGEPKGRESRAKSGERMLALPMGLHVMLALAEGPAHAAEISRRIVGDTMGRYIGGTSLYDEILRLEENGWVMRWHVGWKKEVRLTEEGERILKLKMAEVKRVMEVARDRRIC